MNRATSVKHFAGMGQHSQIKFACFMKLFSERLPDLTPFYGDAIELKNIRGAMLTPEFEGILKKLDLFTTTGSRFMIALVSEVKRPAGLILTAMGLINEGKIENFEIELDRKYFDMSPPYLANLNNQMGGYTQGYADLFSSLGNPRVICDAELRGFIIEPDKFPLKLAPWATLEFGSLKSTEFTVRFADAEKNATLELTRFLDQPIVRFSLKSQIEFELNQDFPTVVWNKLEPIFEPLREENAPIANTVD